MEQNPISTSDIKASNNASTLRQYAFYFRKLRKEFENEKMY